MKKAVVISCFHGWYDNRLKPLISVLQNRGYMVNCYLSDFDHIKKEYVNINTSDICKYIHVPAYKSNISINRIISHLVFGHKINNILNVEKPDLIYLLVPPNNTANYCKNYKKRYPHTKLVLDIIDLWPESLPFKTFKENFLLKYWKDMRNNAIKVSDLVFTECDYYQRILKNEIKDTNFYTLSLFKDQLLEDQELVLNIIHNKKYEEKMIKLAYLGSMNNILDIEIIVRVIKYFINKGFHCELHAIGDGEKRNQFENAIKDTGCSSRFYGAIFDEKTKINILANCDFGLNIMKDISVGLTLKSIEYFSYGLPIINNIKADTWELVEKENIGINIHNDFTEFNLDFSCSHEKVVELFKDRFSIDSFNRQLEFAFNRNGI